MENAMSNALRKIDYFYVMVPNTAGQGSKVLAALAGESVNLLAFSGFPSGGKGQLDLIPENSVKIRRAGKELKLKISKKKTGVLGHGHHPLGAMGKMVAALAQAPAKCPAA